MVETQRWASTRAVFTGLPASAAIVMVRSSSRSATSSRGAVEHRGALVRGELAGVEGRAGGLDGLPDERRVALGDPADQRCRRRGPSPRTTRRSRSTRRRRRACDRSPESSLSPSSSPSSLYPQPSWRHSPQLPAAVPVIQGRCPGGPERSCSPLLGCLPVASSCPVPAAAAKVWVVKGAGFGHGVGMSQYGAYGYAKHGFHYDQILTHYYTGTTIGTTNDQSVRVLLLDGVGGVSFSGAGSACGATLKPGQGLRREEEGGRDRRALQEEGAGRQVRWGDDGDRSAERLRQGQGHLPRLARGAELVQRTRRDQRRRARGLRPRRGGEGVAGVVADRGAQGPGGCRAFLRDLDGLPPAGPSTSSTTPAARPTAGWAPRLPKTDQAVSATHLQVVLYQGKVAQTFFFSTSGGHTENNEFSSLGLRAAADPLPARRRRSL